MHTLPETRLAILGLGYVGLPLAVEFARKYNVVGFDINTTRIAELREGRDHTQEVTREEIQAACHPKPPCHPERSEGPPPLRFSSTPADLTDRNTYIVTVPTPVDTHNRPDFTPLLKASESVGKALRRGAVVIYESTVYPGATEEVCVPVLERHSGLKYNRDFFCGYSPERINPGDRQHRLTTIKKVTAGSTPEVADYVDALYASIVTAGTHKASSIRVAEAAKVIENTQRDLNIALINELAMIFNRLGIDTEEVLQAAGSKWNFLPFRPGLVGGHCIGVDPYYLTHKAEEVGYHPQVILAGRRINDGMGGYVASQVIKLMARKRIQVGGSKILILGFTFKENCPDVRNSRVIDIVEELAAYGAEVDVFDPCADPEEIEQEYGVRTIGVLGGTLYDAVIVAVAHNQFKKMGATEIRNLCKPNGIVYDVKNVLPPGTADARL